VKRILANGVGSQYPSHYLGTWYIYDSISLISSLCENFSDKFVENSKHTLYVQQIFFSKILPFMR
jgi:hypothetical protein